MEHWKHKQHVLRVSFLYCYYYVFGVVVVRLDKKTQFSWPKKTTLLSWPQKTTTHCCWVPSGMMSPIRSSFQDIFIICNWADGRASHKETTACCVPQIPVIGATHAHINGPRPRTFIKYSSTSIDVSFLPLLRRVRTAWPIRIAVDEEVTIETISCLRYS